MNNNVQILSIEGKDLLTKKIDIKKNVHYKGSLDDSIEVDELKKIGKKVIGFNESKQRFYSNDIITVTYNYACKDDISDEYSERVASLEKTLEMLVNAGANKEDIEHTKQLLKLAKQNISKKDIRNQLYKYGFHIRINGKLEHFKRYKRSSGSARVGKCLFINSKYHKRMINWSFSGIKHEENTEMDCSSIESYISLPTSSCIGRMKLEPKNILLIDDGESTFNDTVMAVRFINHEYDEDGNIIGGDLDTNIETTSITNKIWDGENLLDKSVFDGFGYEDKAILQIRNRMFKGIGINTDIQKFFKDNNITRVDQLNGKTIATDIKDIKLITTPSSVKYLKYGTFEKWLKYIVPEWGVCKYEKPQQHFNGMVQTHYQLINTLGMDKETTEKFLEDSMRYVELLKTNLGVFKNHLGLLSRNTKDEEEIDYEVKNISTNAEFILNMLQVSDKFSNTKICKNFRNEVVKNYINNIRKGHVLVNGNYSVVISCPYEFLQASIGVWDGTSSVIKPFECVSSKFDIGEEILGVRSPQPTMANMCIFNNKKYDILDKYFNTSSKEIIMISSIKNNVFELQSSMDVDGDQMEVTNNKHLVEACKKLNEFVKTKDGIVKRFLVPTDFTPKASIKRKYNAEDLADTDIKCSSNKIGEIINLAQMLNTVYWDWKSKGVSEDKLMELYKDICQLDILSCIEIDRCKKISPVNAKKELDKIRAKKYLNKGTIIRDKKKKMVGIRPYFFKYLDGGKDYKFKKFNCGMDFLEMVIDESTKRETQENEIELKDVLVKMKACKADRRKIDRIIHIVKEMKHKQNKIWNSNFSDKWELCEDIYIEYLQVISKIDMTPEIIYTLLLRMSISQNGDRYLEYKKLGRRLLRILYDSNRQSFLKCIKVSENSLSNLTECEDGDVDLYGIKYKNTVKNAHF